MPSLDSKDVQKIFLPSATPDSESYVLLNVLITPPQMFAMQRAQQNTEEAERVTYEILSQLIEGWTYTDPDGKPAEITPQNVARMRFDDLERVSNTVLNTINLTVSTQAVSAGEKKG